jgi:hypothetical protein
LRHQLSPVFGVLFFVFNLSKLSRTHLSASLFRFFETALTVFLLLNPLSPFDYDPFDTRIGGFVAGSIDTSKQFRILRVNSSFFTVLFTGTPNWEGQVRRCKLKVALHIQSLRIAIAGYPVSVSLDCVISCSQAFCRIQDSLSTRPNTVPLTALQVRRSYFCDPALLRYNSPFRCFFNLHIYSYFSILVF